MVEVTVLTFEPMALSITFNPCSTRNNRDGVQTRSPLTSHTRFFLLFLWPFSRCIQSLAEDDEIGQAVDNGRGENRKKVARGLWTRHQRQTSGPVRYWVSKQVSNIEEDTSTRTAGRGFFIVPCRARLSFRTLARFLPTMCTRCGWTF